MATSNHHVTKQRVPKRLEHGVREIKMNQMSHEEAKKQYLLVAGNPGSGKSTILNCLMQSRSSKALQDDQKFQSGISIGSGMTYQLDTKEQDGIVYMDTPGLDDIDKRKQAAEAITQALKKDGSYQVIFVVTLESGRVRPSDVATISLILDSAPEITNFGVVFNKLTKPVLRELSQEKKLALLTQVSARTTEGKSKPLPIPFYLQKINDLENENNAIANLPGLEEYILCLTPIVIHSTRVENIPTEQYEELRLKLEEQLEYFKNNAEAMQRQMEEDRENFKRQYDEMAEENERRHQRDVEEIEWREEQHQQQLKDLKEQYEKLAESMKGNFRRENELVKNEARQLKVEMKDLNQNILDLKGLEERMKQEKRFANMEDERKRRIADRENEQRHKEHEVLLSEIQAEQEKQLNELQRKIEKDKKEKARMEEEHKKRINALEKKKSENGIWGKLIPIGFGVASLLLTGGAAGPFLALL